MDSDSHTRFDGDADWLDRLACLIEAAHDGLVDLALDAASDANLACTLGAVDLRDVLDELRRHESEFPRRDVRRYRSIDVERSADLGLAPVGNRLSKALELVATKAHDNVSLSADELLLLARVAHGLARVLDRLGFPRP